jgi:hypothetical protein
VTMTPAATFEFVFLSSSLMQDESCISSLDSRGSRRCNDGRQSVINIMYCISYSDHHDSCRTMHAKPAIMYI